MTQIEVMGRCQVEKGISIWMTKAWLKGFLNLSLQTNNEFEGLSYLGGGGEAVEAVVSTALILHA